MILTCSVSVIAIIFQFVIPDVVPIARMSNTTWMRRVCYPIKRVHMLGLVVRVCILLLFLWSSLWSRSQSSQTGLLLIVRVRMHTSTQRRKVVPQCMGLRICCDFFDLIHKYIYRERERYRYTTSTRDITLSSPHWCSVCWAYRVPHCSVLMGRCFFLYFAYNYFSCF